MATDADVSDERQLRDAEVDFVEADVVARIEIVDGRGLRGGRDAERTAAQVECLGEFILREELELLIHFAREPQASPAKLEAVLQRAERIGIVVVKSDPGLDVVARLEERHVELNCSAYG